DYNCKDKIIIEQIPYEQVIQNSDLIPCNWISMPQSLKLIAKDLELLKNQQKIISDKKFYSKNFLFFGDSSSEKTTITENLAQELAQGREICKKANDPKYFDKYNNHKVIIKQELTYDMFNFEDLLLLYEKDQCIIKQYNKKSIEVVSKYNIFTAQDQFDDIFSFHKWTFDNKSIKIVNRYISKKVDYYFIWTEPDELGDINDFMNGQFDIKICEGLDLESAKKYVYDKDFENLYELKEDIYLK
ncbi:17430_t:CDS:2, partial [Dentiscutata heterogama]